jgi:hypothetical protein
MVLVTDLEGVGSGTANGLISHGLHLHGGAVTTLRWTVGE